MGTPTVFRLCAASTACNASADTCSLRSSRCCLSVGVLLILIIPVEPTIAVGREGVSGRAPRREERLPEGTEDGLGAPDADAESEKTDAATAAAAEAAAACVGGGVLGGNTYLHI